MGTRKTNDKKVETVQRLLRWPKTIDEWLEQTAVVRGYPNVQEFVRQIVREAKEKEAA